MKSILELIWDGINDFVNGEESENENNQYLAMHPADKYIYVGCVHERRPRKLVDPFDKADYC